MRLVSNRLLATTIVCAGVTVGVAGHARAQSAVDLDHLTATQAAADLCAGKYKSEALVSAVIARAKARPELNAFITIDEAGALRQARAYDAAHARHASCKPLGGVPIAIKDNIEVAGLPATAGTPALRGYVPAADAPVVA
ncbi:MAG: amidase family protein, partial [Bradyrhizobium sp.]